MNKDLIFREPVYNSDNKFIHFHYWGFNTEEGSNFTGPTTPTKRIKPKPSEKYICLMDKNKTPVHEGDIICFNEKYGKEHIKYGVVKGGVRGYCFDVDCGDTNYNSSAYHLITDESHQGYVVGNIHENPEIIIPHLLAEYVKGLTPAELKKIQTGRIISIKDTDLPLPTKEFAENNN